MYEKVKKKENLEDNIAKMSTFSSSLNEGLRVNAASASNYARIVLCYVIIAILQLRIRLRFKRIGCVFIPSVNLRLFSGVDKKLNIFYVNYGC